MKKTLSLVLAMVLLFAAATCAVAEDVVTLEVWRMSNTSETLNQAYDDLAADFEAETGIKVNYVNIATNDFATKLVTNISAQQYPDIVITNRAFGVQYASTGAVASVDDVVDEVGRDKWSDSLCKLVSVDGKMWGIPVFTRPSGVHIRKSWAEEAGYDMTPQVDENGIIYYEGLRTYEDLYTLGEKMMAVIGAEGKYPFGFQYSRLGHGDTAGNLIGIMQSYGAFLLNENGEVAVNCPEAIEALSYVKKIWDNGLVPAAATTWDGNANNLYFISGDVGIVNNSNSILGKLGADTAFTADDVVVLPALEGPTGLAYYNGNPEDISVFNTKNVDAAKAFAKYMLRTDVQLKMFATMGVGYYMPLFGDVMADEMFADLTTNQKVFMQRAPHVADSSFPSDINAKISNAFASYVIDDCMSYIAVDGWTPEEVVEWLEGQLNDYLND